MSNEIDANDNNHYIPDSIVELILQNLPEQNTDSDFSSSERQYSTQSRKLIKSHFFTKLSNGMLVKRKWLLYSETSKKSLLYPVHIV